VPTASYCMAPASAHFVDGPLDFATAVYYVSQLSVAIFLVVLGIQATVIMQMPAFGHKCVSELPCTSVIFQNATQTSKPAPQTDTIAPRTSSQHPQDPRLRNHASSSKSL
jgi:hypothetical protein